MSFGLPGRPVGGSCTDGGASTDGPSPPPLSTPGTSGRASSARPVERAFDRARGLGGSFGSQTFTSREPCGQTDGSYLGRSSSSLMPGWLGPSQPTHELAFVAGFDGSLSSISSVTVSFSPGCGRLFGTSERALYAPHGPTKMSYRLKCRRWPTSSN